MHMGFPPTCENTFDMGFCLFDILCKSRLWKSGLHIGKQAGQPWTIVKGQITYPFVRHPNQTLSERRGVKTVGNFQPFSTQFIFSGSQCLGRYKQIVQAARAWKPAVVSHLQQVLRLIKQRLGVLFGQELQKFLGTNARPAGEYFLKVKVFLISFYYLNLFVSISISLHGFLNFE